MLTTVPLRQRPVCKPPPRFERVKTRIRLRRLWSGLRRVLLKRSRIYAHNARVVKIVNDRLFFRHRIPRAVRRAWGLFYIKICFGGGGVQNMSPCSLIWPTYPFQQLARRVPRSRLDSYTRFRLRARTAPQVAQGRQEPVPRPSRTPQSC